jgi:hypothetical protein
MGSQLIRSPAVAVCVGVAGSTVPVGVGVEVAGSTIAVGVGVAMAGSTVAVAVGVGSGEMGEDRNVLSEATASLPWRTPTITVKLIAHTDTPMSRRRCRDSPIYRPQVRA